MIIIIPKGVNYFKIYINICKILLKMIILGLLLIFDFQKPKYPKIAKFQYQNEIFCTKNENFTT